MTPTHHSGPRESVDLHDYLAAQPPERQSPNALEHIQGLIADSGRRLVVLDDDPTGTQSVHDVPVLTTWSEEDLRWAFRQPSQTFFILTNSRSLPEKDAVLLNREVAGRVASVASEAGESFAIVSRSDSTLRGYYPAEIDALRGVLEDTGHEIDGVVLCPCFLEAGRLTIENVHWVKEGETLTPVGNTEFASDASFGYESSNLAAWIQEKTNGEITAGEVLSIGLSDLRLGGPEAVFELLGEARDGRPIIVNAAAYSDLETFVLGLLKAEAAGKSFLYRTGPSFVRVRGGITEKPPLGTEDLFRLRPLRGYGLVLVGSHVEMTTRQLEEAIDLGGSHTVEISVERLLDPAENNRELDRVSTEINRSLKEFDVIAYTSRQLVTESAGQTSLDIGRTVSDALVEVMRRVDRSLPLGFVIAKGGITSSDIGTKGLGVHRAEVAGTMLPGIIPVWILPEDNEFPGLPYIIFPGNVGDQGTLAEVMERLRSGSE